MNFVIGKKPTFLHHPTSILSQSFPCTIFHCLLSCADTTLRQHSKTRLVSISLGKEKKKTLKEEKKKIKNLIVSVSHLMVQLQNQLYEHYCWSNWVMETGMERLWASTSEVPAKTGHPTEPNSSMSGSGWKLDGTTWGERKGFLRFLKQWVQVWLPLWLKRSSWARSHH